MTEWIYKNRENCKQKQVNNHKHQKQHEETTIEEVPSEPKAKETEIIRRRQDAPIV